MYSLKIVSLYQSREALHLSEKERTIVLKCFSKIKFELEQGADKHTKLLIAANIELFLNYCVRFYDGQFLTSADANTDVVARFEALLDKYFRSADLQNDGFPSIAYCAAEMNLSANYFGDLIKKETGMSPLQILQIKLIDLAKEKLLSDSKSINEIAFKLGYKYPQHFVRSFKKITGHTPTKYRSLN